MKRQLYELLWEIVTDVNSSSYREFKVFSSHAEAKQYGKRRKRELNGGVSIEERAQDGYYYKYIMAVRVKEVDSNRICLVDRAS